MGKNRLLLLSLLLSITLSNLVNDDNYIMFNNQMSASNSLPGADGTLYLLGTSITKFNLTNKSVIASKKF
jgi:hypothetical protein